MTEKSYSPDLKEKKMHAKTEIAHSKVSEAPVKKETSEKTTEKKVKKVEVKKEIAPKTEAVVREFGAPVSTKTAADLCRFVKYKPIAQSLKELAEVLDHKRAIPMRGEIPHRKGRMAGGGYPLEATKLFIKMLKALSANASVNGITEPRVTEAIANIAYRPYGRFGSVRRKRTHITLTAQSKRKVTK